MTTPTEKKFGGLSAFSRFLDKIKEIFVKKSEVNVISDGQFIKKANTAASNITALDTAAKNSITGLSASGTTVTYTKGDGTSNTITTQDTVYEHPTTAGNKHIPSGGSSGQILKYGGSSGTAVWANNEAATKYTASDGITLTDTNFTNSGVRAVSASTTNGKIKVNTNGTETDITAYTHPTTAGNKHIPSGGSSGQLLKYSASGTATWATISASDVGAAPSDIDTGVMSVSEGSTNGTISVDGTDIAVHGLGSGAYADEYVHPTTAGNKHIPSGGSTGQILKYSAAGTATWANEYSYTHPVSGATAGDYGPSDDVTGTNNTTISVPAITVDANGHITSIENKTYTSKDTVYEHPTTSGNKHIPSGGGSGKILKWSSDGTATWETEYSYTHPSTAGNKHIPTGGSTGQVLKYGGSSGTATWSTLSASDVGAAPSDIDTGVMSVTASSTNGKVSVDGTDVAVYTHPTTAGNKHIPSGGSSGNILKYSAAGTAAWGTLSASDVGASATGHKHTKSDITDFPTIPTITDTYSGTSSDGMSGKAVKSAIDSALVSAYKPSGSVAYASLPTLAASVMGNVYNVTDSFTIDNRFVEYDSSKTQTFPAGTEVAVINTGTSGSPTYKFSVMSGFIDLSRYQQSSTAVTHTASTAVGSTKKPVYVNSSGVATEISYTIEKSVPSNAVFTDTTYTGSDGVTLTGTNFTNSGVRAVSASSTNGKIKVNTNGTESDVTVYTHPTTAGNKHIPTGGSSGQILKYSASGTATWANEYSYTHPNTEVTEDTYGPSDDVTGTNNTTINVPYFTVNAQGHITAAGNKVYTSKDTVYTHPTTAGNKHVPVSVGSATQPVYSDSNGVLQACTYSLNKTVPSNAVFTDNDTKNTAGSTDTSSKIFLVGTTSQAANAQSYSHDTVFVDTNGRLNSAAPASDANDTTVATTKWVKDQSYKTSVSWGDVTGKPSTFTPPTASSTTLGGIKVGTNLSISNGVLSATDTTYSDATQSVHGLMSTTDKTKLDGIATGANAYTHPSDGANTGSFGPSANASPAHGGTFSVPYVTVNAAGHVTAASTKTITLPAAPTSVTSASKLTTGRAIDGVTFDGQAAITHFGTCSTAAATAAKTVACTSFTLVTGSRIVVKFTVTNTAANPTLNVNSTGAKAIQYRGAAITAGYLAANRTYEFIYDGTNYQLVGDLDTNTTYSAATTSAAGLMSAADKTKLDGIATSANAYVHPSYTARTGKPTANATPAFGGTFTVSQITSDATGHVTGATDRTITIPATTMTAATSSAAGASGLVPAPSAGDQNKFLRGDGTWQTTGSSYTAMTANEASTGTSTTARVISAKVLHDKIEEYDDDHVISDSEIIALWDELDDSGNNYY